MNSTRKEKAKQAINWIGKGVSILSVLFVVYAIYKLGFDFESIQNIPLFLLVSLIGVLIKAMTVILSGYAWSEWLTYSAGHPIDRKAAIRAYGKANVGKYLPGNVMHYVERNLFASNLGISQKGIALSSVAEIICMVFAALGIAVIVFYQQLVYVWTHIFGEKSQLLFNAAVMAAVIALVCVAVYLAVTHKMPHFTRQKACQFTLTGVKALVEYAVVLIALGVIMVFLFAYMGGELSWNVCAQIISGYIIAWLLGFITPGASGGMGVREVVITLLLSSVIGDSLVVTLSVIHRLITIVGDFLVYLVVIIKKK